MKKREPRYGSRIKKCGKSVAVIEVSRVHFLVELACLLCVEVIRISCLRYEGIFLVIDVKESAAYVERLARHTEHVEKLIGVELIYLDAP